MASFGSEAYASYLVDAMAHSWTRNLGIDGYCEDVSANYPCMMNTRGKGSLPYWYDIVERVREEQPQVVMSGEGYSSWDEVIRSNANMGGQGFQRFHDMMKQAVMSGVSQLFSSVTPPSSPHHLTRPFSQPLFTPLSLPSLHFAPFLSLFCPAQLPMPHLFPLTPPLPHAFALLAPQSHSMSFSFLSILPPSFILAIRSRSHYFPHLATPARSCTSSPSPSRPSSHQLKRPFQCSSVHLVARIATHPMASGCKQARTYCQLLWRRRSNGPVLPASCL